VKCTAAPHFEKDAPIEFSTISTQVDVAQDFFGREAFLTVSGQLNVEAYCLALTMAERGIDREHYAWYRAICAASARAACRLRPGLRSGPASRHPQ
jgi:hypothetical protein